MEDQLMEMVGGSESNVWKLYESIMCIYFDMEEIIKQAVYLQGAYDRERMLKMCIRDRGMKQNMRRTTASTAFTSAKAVLSRNSVPTWMPSTR